MKAARLRLILASIAFLAWLAWLAMAVAQKGKPDILSRAQLTEATTIVVAEVTADPAGLPIANVKVAKMLKGTVPAVGETIRVDKLTSAAVPGKGFPGAGTYLIPVVEKDGQFIIAGLPRSPGYEVSAPERPAIYPWNDDTQKQLKKLGIEP